MKKQFGLNTYGAPIDYCLYKLEQLSMKPLELHPMYKQLCDILTALDFDEPIPFNAKKICYDSLLAITKWCFNIDKECALKWINSTVNEWLVNITKD